MTIHSVVIQKLLSTNAHMGRRAAAHHFKIYSYGARNGMTIIDSDKTVICLRNACNFIGNLVKAEGRILFVNTNSLFDGIIEHMTKTIGIKNDTSWRLGGFLTNSLSPKKFRGRNKKLNLGAVVPPDCVVIFDTERKSSVILEASKLQVPIVGLVDPSMPYETFKRITYPVPANDSVQFVYLFCNLITKTVLYEKKRLRDTVRSSAKEEIDPHAEVQVQETVTARKKGEIFVIPYESLPTVSDDSIMHQLLNKVVVLKLNATLGTEMGITEPKSVIELYDGTTCLDITINQIESVNSKYGCNIPLLLANTIYTEDATLKVLERHPTKNIHTFLQSDQQKSVSEDLLDGEDKSDNAMFPSNLDEIFISMKKSGRLDVLLSQGKEYILVLSSENLASAIDTNILNYLMEKNVESCVEVLPVSVDPEEVNLSVNEGKFESKKKLQFTNIMWFSMTSILKFFQKKTVNENHTISEALEKALAINIPKSRYLPVEKTSNLLLFQSDLYSVVDGILTRNTVRSDPADPSIELGPEFDKMSEFRSRFKSMPSIVELDSLKVTGNVWFGAGVTLKGKVVISASPETKIVIPDGAVLQNKVISRQKDIEDLL